MEVALNMFRRYDVDNTGTISEEDMKRILQKVGVEGSDDDFCAMFQAADANHDGVVDYGEFFAWLFNPLSLTGGFTGLEQLESMLKAHGLLPEGSKECAVFENELVQSEAGMLALMQRQLLLRLGRDRSDFHVSPSQVDRREELMKLGAMQRLLSNKLLLETFLSSGDCGIANPARLSPKLSQDRWASAVDVLLRMMEHDPRVESGKPEDALQMRLAVGAALAFSSPVALLDDDDALIDPVERYENYLRWHASGLLFPSFEKQGAWQMRYLFICKQADDELEWAHENCSDMRSARDDAGDASSVCVPNGMVQYQGERNGADINDKAGYYGHDGHITLQEYHEMGGVCGAICFFGTAMCQAFGLPAMLVGQPGHCAMIFQRGPGHWYLGNDISGWTASNDLEGGVVWDIPLMEQAQANFEDYSRSERLRTAAELAPMEHRGDLLAKASLCCPFNMAVWEARAEHLKEAAVRGHDCDSEAWVAESIEMLRENWFGKESTVISKGRPVNTSDAAYEYHAQHLVDCGEAVWWTEQNSGYIDIDLGEPQLVNRVSIFWAGPLPEAYSILASPEEPSWPREVSRGCAVAASEFEDMAPAVTDGEGYGGGDTIWFAEGDTAWVLIELKEPCDVSEMHIEWWGLAVASSYTISSSSDGVEFTPQRTQEDAKSHPNHLDGEINGWSGGIPGWSEPTTHVKIELADGHEDGWGHNKLFGLRNVRVMGYDSQSKRDGEIPFEEVSTHTSAENGEQCSVLPGWDSPTRVVRLQLIEVGQDSQKFGIQQFNVHGGPSELPTTAVDVLRAEVSYQLDKETVCAKYYGGNSEALRTGLASESSSGKDRPLLCAVEHIHARIAADASHAPPQMTADERKHWSEKGFACSPDARLLICENTSAHGDEFSPSRDLCCNDGTGGWAEYTVEFLASGAYDLYTHLAADDLRPLCLHLDGNALGKVAGRGTRSWDDMKWFKEKWQLNVQDAGVHTIRLDTEGSYPHISAMLFSPADSDSRAVTNESDDEAEYVSSTKWADDAFQLRGSQEDYDRVMGVDFSEREAEYLKIESEVADLPPPTKWADEAFQIRGSQEDYDRVMDVDIEEREAEYLKIESEVADLPPPTKWADEAFQIRGSQEDYDRVMDVDIEEREAEYLKIKSEVGDD